MKPWPLLVLAIASCPGAFCDTVNLNPVADTTISEGNSANTQSVPGHMIVGHLQLANAMSRGLLRFDVNGIPSGAVVTSATLTVTVTASSSSGDIHALHRMTAPWVESTATWSQSGIEEWLSAGGDYQSSPDATLNIGGAGEYMFLSTPGLVSTVQTWVDNTNSNHGWVLRSQSEASGRNGRRFTTIEESNTLPVTTLTVDYTIPTPPPTLTLSNPRVGDGMFKFDFNAEPGFAYIGQYKEALHPGDWTDFAWIPDPGVSTLTTVEDPLTNTNRFYRVIVATWP